MLIVEADKIPTREEIKDVPMDNPMEVYKVCQELEEVCKKEHGIGISAVQVGVPWKLFLVLGDGTCPLIPKGQFGYFVNCEYDPITEEKQVVSLEGCLSLRSEDGRLRSFQVERYEKIRLFGFQLRFDKTLIFEEVDSPVDVSEQGIIFQHEADHQLGPDGLISVKGKEVFVW